MNLQGDVIEIIARNGISVANYSYDAFGNPKVYDAEFEKLFEGKIIRKNK